MINLIYVILLSLPLYLVRFSVFGIPTTVLEVEIYIAVIWLLIAVVKSKSLKVLLRNVLRNPLFAPLVLFFVSGLLSVLVASDTIMALGIFKAYFVDSVLFFFLFISIVKTKEEIKNSLLAVSISGVALAVIGFVGYFGYTSFLEDGRLRSVFSSPNYLSLYIAPLVFLAIGRATKPKTMRDKGLFLVGSIVLILLLALILTLSRGAWLAVLVGLAFAILVLVMRRFSTNKLIIASGFVLSIFVILLFIIRGLYLFGAIPSDRVEKSDSIRIEVWQTSWDMVQENWARGIGLGSFQEQFGERTKNLINYPEYITPHAITPHNMALNLWLQAGLLGLIAVFWLIARFFLIGLKIAKKNFLIILAISSSMVAILAHGLVESTIWKNDLMIYFWFLLAVMTVVNKLDHEKEK